MRPFLTFICLFIALPPLITVAFGFKLIRTTSKSVNFNKVRCLSSRLSLIRRRPCASCTFSGLHSDIQVKSYNRIPPPELPPGESLEKFAKTCEYCGDVFGFDYTYKCLYDPTYQTYKDCLLGLSKR